YIAARRLIAPHVTLFVRNMFAVVPTTELAQLIGIPFVRTGSRFDDIVGGVEAAVSKHTSVTASYHFEWVHFLENQTYDISLLGGHSHGSIVSVRHEISRRTA